MSNTHHCMQFKWPESMSTGTGTTSSKHPLLLRRGCRDICSDKLRRLAIKNSFQSHDERVGTPHPHTGKILPPIHTHIKISDQAKNHTQKDVSAKRSSTCFANANGNSVALPWPQARAPPAPPCTTTTLDFQRHPVLHRMPRFERCGTPRGNNPHPVGLVFQSPYNRHNKTFEIWNPDISVIESRLPNMFTHIGHTNFTSGQPKSYVPSRATPPDVHYSTASVYRYCFQRPQSSVQYDTKMPTTRFGSTANHLPAVGVVPNVMSPRIHIVGKHSKLSSESQAPSTSRNLSHMNHCKT